MNHEPITFTPNPEFDLVLERIVPVPPERVWRAWTRPEQLKQWFCPLPWRVVDCRIDLRPGGEFYTCMQSPDGDQFPGSGCYLELIEHRRLVWTSAMGPGYRPLEAQPDGMPFTGVIEIHPHESGTRYVAMAIHPDKATAEKHAAMGFHDGWGAALQQLVDMVLANPEE